MNGDAFSTEIEMKHVRGLQPATAEPLVAPAADPYRVIQSIRTLRRELGLTSNDLVTLQALISFMPRKDSASDSGMTIVFPSNASLSERTNGLDERTLRRCISRLVGSGLINRRDSATGKRFPLRYGGVIRDAFGFDLAPMYLREQELKAWAKQISHDAENLRSLKAKALALRVEALANTQDEKIVAILADMRKILRRTTLSQADVTKIIDQLQGMLGDHGQTSQFPAGNQSEKSTKTDEMSATNGQNDRLVEPKTLKYKNKGQLRSPKTYAPKGQLNPNTMEWNDLVHVSSFYPKEPRDKRSVLQIITDIGSLLKVSKEKLIAYLHTKGPGRVLLALDTIIGKAGQIRHPAQYLDRVLS